jgi:hypothetical protein
MKAVPHPDKGGAGAPLALPPGEPASIAVLARLYELLLDVERRLAAGPWCRWDEALLNQWRDAAREQIAACETDLRLRYEPLWLDAAAPHADYEIIDS